MIEFAEEIARRLNADSFVILHYPSGASPRMLYGGNDHKHRANTVDDYARYLKIAVSTVKVHRKHIYAKLSINSQAELFTLFLKIIAGTCDEAGVDPLDVYSRSQPISGTLTDD
jgi:hypothetical protein